jgi:hypothetical protein
MSNQALNAWCRYRAEHPDEVLPADWGLDEAADWCGWRVEELEAEKAQSERERDQARAEVARLREQLDEVSAVGIKLALDRGERQAEAARLKGWQRRTARCVQLLLATPHTDDAGLRGNLLRMLALLLREAEGKEVTL